MSVGYSNILIPNYLINDIHYFSILLECGVTDFDKICIQQLC